MTNPLNIALAAHRDVLRMIRDSELKNERIDAIYLPEDMIRDLQQLATVRNLPLHGDIKVENVWVMPYEEKVQNIPYGFRSVADNVNNIIEEYIKRSWR